MYIQFVFENYHMTINQIISFYQHIMSPVFRHSNNVYEEEVEIENQN